MLIRNLSNWGVFIGAALLVSCSAELPEEVMVVYQDLPESIDFSLHVKPILSDKCFLCHGPDEENQKAGLRLDLAEDAYSTLEESPGKYAIVPGHLKKSEVFHRLISTDPEHQMPPPESKLQLTAYEKAVIIKWIEEGAEYKPHWAFIKPSKQNPPKPQAEKWNYNPIDQWVFHELKKQDLDPSPEADKELLLRRLSFDLTGLPPDLKSLDNFLKDNSDQAYEKQVDRLLASPHFGEKMAADWMDLARYADTHGYLADRYRDMSPWRDWVIQAFNKNMPYDQFITWQLAGDLLPNPTREQLLATGFNRLHPQNLEDGIIDEEFRVAYVSDRTDVMGQGLMGLTLACAKCHDHKYDPISQKNYYELFSFFNNINESGLISWEGATPVPSLMIPTKKQEEILAFLEKAVLQQEEAVERAKTEAADAFEQWLGREQYRTLPQNFLPDGLTAHFTLDKPYLENRIYPTQKGKMARRFSKNEKPEFTDGKQGRGLLLDGDAWLDLGEIGIFKRNEAFSIGLQVMLPEELEDGYFFHKGMGTRLHSFRGYHLYLKEKKLELMMAHTWPENAIIEYADTPIPREEWVQLMVTYDGSSKAAGFKLYLNGKELKTDLTKDNLYKDIIFHDLVDPIYPEPIEPGLQIGARWRGKGLRGAAVDDIMVFERELTALEVLQIGDPEGCRRVLVKSKEELSNEEIEMLSSYFLANRVPAYQRELNALERSREAYVDSAELVQQVMIMKEMPQRRKAFVLKRGQYDEYGEEVFRNTPEAILSMPEDLPKNRLGLAKWLCHPDHPLTARVAVNRYWQHFFGRGLVKTTEDFGNQGALPSHPELLDYLAVQFMESGWDVKALLKLIVMSVTYRQDSKADQTLREKDPENIWLARGPSLRLTAEMIRDNALFASGLLNTKIGGESVKPYQPEGLWKMNNAVYRPDEGDKLYRRSLYTFWKRSVPHPTLATFDAPDKSECTVRRQKTNTPLQALVLLNDPAYLEAARLIGEQVSLAEDLEKGIRDAFIRLTGRGPKPKEMKILLRLQEEELQIFNAHPNKGKGWLSAGVYPVASNLDPNLLAANTVLASVIMNTDASITKR